MFAAYDRVKRKTSVAEKYSNHQLLDLFSNLRVYIVHVLLIMVIYCVY